MMGQNPNPNPNMNMNGGMNTPMGSVGGEKKSGSLVWAIVAVVIVALLGYLLVKSGNNTDDTMSPQDQASENIQNDTIGTQSDSTDINSIDADLNATNLGTLDVELE